MKKIIYLFCLFLYFQMPVFGQITGTGTNVDPYTGTITSASQNFTINGPFPKYFDQIDISDGILTVPAGATLYAKNTTSYIVITLTGALNADGTSGSIITFTADNDGNGVADPTESWQNISFNESTGQSKINYAIIERGTGNSNFGLGGGVLAYGNNITVSNSTIRYCNIAGDGGGFYVLSTGPNNLFQNLVIHDNNAEGVGGGLVLDGATTSTVSGCNIYSNTSTDGAGAYFRNASLLTNSMIHNNFPGDGIYVDVTGSGASITNCIIYGNDIGIYLYGDGKAVNCDIVNNTTGIRSPNTPAPKVVNSVLWGNTTQYNIIGGSLELANCGIQGGLSGGTDGGGNVAISSTNGADTGPNFVSTSTPDYHLNAWIAPLVDGGISSYPGVTIPGSDFEGKSRIGPTDIGAYEFTYFIWTGTTSTNWSTSTNWVGSPSSIPTSIIDNKVVIPKGKPNYPTVSSLSLSTRSVLTMEPQSGLKVTGSTSVGSGCTFLLQSDATGSANFITGSSVSGVFTMKQFLAGGSSPDYKWHYVTSPINDYAKSVLTTDIGNNYNLLNYREDLVTTDKAQGWNWHDTNGSTTPGFSTLLISRGYNVYVTSDQTATYSGTPRVGTDFTNSSLTSGTGDLNIRGWNLIGNPFTSAVNANPGNFVMTRVDASIYFTKDNQYMSFNTVTGVETGNGVSNIVLPLQGFFIHASQTVFSKSVKILASSRIYTTNSLYKGTSGPEAQKNQNGYTFPILKFNVTDGASLTDDAIVYFFDDATAAFDTLYDAYKLLSNNQVYPQIYTVSENTNFSINGLQTPSVKTTVPVNVRIGVAKTYSFNVINLENLADYKVTLIHGTNRIDLKANPSYTFSGTTGTLTDMFIEFDNSIVTDINDPSKDQTSCWYSNRSVFIKTGLAGFEDNSSVSIYDLNGKVVFSKNNISLGKGEAVEIPVNLSNGFYLTNVVNKNIRFVKKIVISR